MKKNIFYVVTFLIGISLQVVVPKLFSPFGFTPQFLLILTMYIALIRGPVVGELMGFLWGLSADGISVALFGSQALLLTIIGFISGKMNKTLDESKSWAQIMFVLMLSCLYFIGLYIVYHIFAEPGRHISITSLIFHPLINALLAPVIFWFFKHWVQWWFPKSSLRIKL
ncbi:MAG: rod shape-determining protein MreD [bacterium]